MATANLNKSAVVSDGNDGVVIVNCLGDIPSGRTLNVEDWASDTISAGHVIVINSATGEMKPLSISSNAYGSLPTGYAYCGILKVSVTKDDPRAAIMTIGQVQTSALPYAVTSGIKQGLSRIEFL